jgi:hypothetical protein
MISQRTQDALRAAKTRGVILGNAKQAEAATFRSLMICAATTARN